MQGKKIVIVIVLCMAVVTGWLFVVKDKVLEERVYKENIAQADEWVKAGLYQRAIGKYEEALAYKGTEESWKKLINAYERRMEEDEEIDSEYENAMISAIEDKPGNVEFYKKLIEYYRNANEYQSAYKWLQKAKEAGAWDEYLEKAYLEVVYTYELQGHEYTEFKGMAAGAYSVTNGYEWHRIGTDGNEIEEDTYEYVNLAGEEGVKLVNFKEDSRLIDSENMVMGIFPEKCEDAGVYAQGRIPVKYQGKYAYYDEFAQKQFGAFDEAGTFFEGSAAVRTDKKWEIINAEGEKIGDVFADIVLDKEGCYNKQSVILAAKKTGEYHLYNKKLEEVDGFVCQEVDICTEDGVIACKKDGKWGYVDLDGNMVIEPQYEAAKSFSNGLAAVCIDGKWGFIDKNNILVIENIFVDADYFNEAGSCMVSTNVEIEREINADTGETERTEEPVWELLKLEVTR